MSVPSGSSFLRGPVWLVVALALLYLGSVVLVESGGGPRLESGRRAESRRLIPFLVPGADGESSIELTVTDRNGSPHRVYQARSAAGCPVGWVIFASGPGPSDTLEVLVGVDAEAETLTGLWLVKGSGSDGDGAPLPGKSLARIVDRTLGELGPALRKHEPPRG